MSFANRSVHPARRRTHSITVTLRSAHSTASSSTSESDSLPVSSACKAQRWYESQSRRLNNEGERFFPRFARTDWRYAPLRTALRSASPKTKLLPTALHSTSTPPSTFLDPPLGSLHRAIVWSPVTNTGTVSKATKTNRIDRLPCSYVIAL